MVSAMPRTALSLYGVFVLFGFCLRALVHRRQTGSLGLRLPDRSARLEWVAGVLFVFASLTVGVIAPLLQLAGLMTPVPGFDGPRTRAQGGVLFAVGFVSMLTSQLVMGASWRIGVARGEPTTVITARPFAWVRNPIFASAVVASVGLAALVPNAAAFAGVALLVVAVELQVRWVEEPYLMRQHGSAYRRYAARTGRFVPGVGRL